MKNFYFKNKKILNFILITFFSVSFFSIARICYAGAIDVVVTTVVGWIASLFVAIAGAIMSLAIKAVIQIAQYNNFIDEPTIKEAWVIIRDLCNMFFVLILLVIAFATILKIETYNLKKTLPKLLIMAVLINFSKTICGLIVDFSQVIMLTFVSAFQDGGGNFVSILNVDKYLALATDSASWEITETKSLNLTSTVVGMITAVLFLVISAIVMIVLLEVLAMRIVMLWIYVILSPLAFLLSAFPAGAKYASQWWSEFSKQVVVGPILAFFIWLALTTSSKINFNLGSEGQSACFGLSKIMCLNDFMNFIIAIGMLIGGLIVTQQLGGMAGSAAGKGIGWIRGGAGVGKAVSKAGLFKAGRTLDTIQMWGQKKTLSKAWKDYTPKSLNYRMIAAGWKANKTRDMEKYESYAGPYAGYAWQDTFGKYVRLGQYGAVRRSRKKQEEREKDAGKFDFESKVLQRRINFSKTKESDIESVKNEYLSKKDSVISQYKEMGLNDKDAEKKFNVDLSSIGDKNFDIESADIEIEDNIKKATELRKKEYIGFKGAAQYEPIYSKSGAKELIEKEVGAIKQRSDNDFAVVSELLEGLDSNDNNRIVASLSVLAENNDLNELLKDSRVINLMTKQNGLLERLAKEGVIQGDIKEIKKDYRSNPVTPAYLQAFVQGLFKQTNLNDKMAARYANQVGGISFGAGNTVAYGMSYGDVATGGYKFNDLQTDKDGKKLEISKGRNQAMVGKFSNLESQTKIRTMHPDVIIKEGSDGSAAGIHEGGVEYLKSLTSHDLGQINRLRLDVIRKIGSSKQTLREMKKLADTLAKSDDKKDQNQAEIIKYFTGYIKAKYDGKGELKDKKAAEEVYKEIET